MWTHTGAQVANVPSARKKSAYLQPYNDWSSCSACGSSRMHVNTSGDSTIWHTNPNKALRYHAAAAVGEHAPHERTLVRSVLRSSASNATTTK